MKKLKVTVEGQVYEVEVEPIDAPQMSSPSPAPKTAASSGGGDGEEVVSPLAGKVVEIMVREGDEVAEGDTLIVLEAMKMNTHVSASLAGTVGTIHVGPGDMVEEGRALVTIA